MNSLPETRLHHYLESGGQSGPLAQPQFAGDSRQAVKEEDASSSYDEYQNQHHDGTLTKGSRHLRLEQEGRKARLRGS
jgi:hypothetical protein